MTQSKTSTPKDPKIYKNLVRPITVSFPDFSAIGDNLISLNQKISDSFRPLIELSKSFQEKYAETANAYQTQFVEIAKKMQEQNAEFMAGFSKIIKPLLAIDALGEVQCVYWERLSPRFVDGILLSDNVDEFLMELCSADNFKRVDAIIKKCSSHSLLEDYKRLFDQIIDSYNNKRYDLPVIGLFSIIDGLLSDVSGDQRSVKIGVRAKSILEAIKESPITVSNEDISFIALALTFEKTMKSISEGSDFAEADEPNNLNRHWVVHGRSHSPKTQLDCIKLINFIYGIILIDEFNNAEFI